MAELQFYKGDCNTCGKLSSKVCGNCGRCVDCAGCRTGRCTRGIPDFYRAATFNQNSLRRGLGVEYEIGRFNGAAETWLTTITNSRGRVLSMHRDGSVKPSESEWVTNGPLVGDEGLQTLRQISNFLNASNSCDANITCGFHVHVDACKETSAAVRRFLWLYLRLERDIYTRLCAPERWNNTACVPLLSFIQSRRQHRNFKPDDLVSPSMKKLQGFTGFILSLYGIQAEESYDFKVNANFWRGLRRNQHGFGYERANNPRYCGMNLHAWYRQGSIEWRMKEQTVKRAYDGGDDLVYWPLFCGHFTDLGLRLPEEDLRRITRLEDLAELHLLPPDVEAWLTTRLQWRATSVPPPLQRPNDTTEREERQARVYRDIPINPEFAAQLRRRIDRDPFLQAPPPNTNVTGNVWVDALANDNEPEDQDPF